MAHVSHSVSAEPEVKLKDTQTRINDVNMSNEDPNPRAPHIPETDDSEMETSSEQPDAVDINDAEKLAPEANSEDILTPVGDQSIGIARQIMHLQPETNQGTGNLGELFTAHYITSL